jgi:hypothetical protein
MVWWPWSPQPDDHSFQDWWSWVSTLADTSVHKGLDSLIILGAWTIWRYRNACIFNQATPCLSSALVLEGEEFWKWNMVGARGFSDLEIRGQVGMS